MNNFIRMTLLREQLRSKMRKEEYKLSKKYGSYGMQHRPFRTYCSPMLLLTNICLSVAKGKFHKSFQNCRLIKIPEVKQVGLHQSWTVGLYFAGPKQLINLDGFIRTLYTLITDGDCLTDEQQAMLMLEDGPTKFYPGASEAVSQVWRHRVVLAFLGNLIEFIDMSPKELHEAYAGNDL